MRRTALQIGRILRSKNTGFTQVLVISMKLSSDAEELLLGAPGVTPSAPRGVGRDDLPAFGIDKEATEHGATIRSPRDIGWTMTLTAGHIMRKDWVAVRDNMTVADFRMRVPLGSASKAVMTDAEGRYCGIVATTSAYRPDLAAASPLKALATLTDRSLTPATGIQAMLHMFDGHTADEMAVVDERGLVLGVVSEKHAHRRYFEEIEASQRALSGET